MADLTLVDTDILIDAGRGLAEAVECLQQIEQRSLLAISVITQMELLIGCRNKAELRRVERFLQRFQVIRLNEPICDVAVDLLRRFRLSHNLPPRTATYSRPAATWARKKPKTTTSRSRTSCSD